MAGRNLEERALTAAVIASIRHRHTNYDELLGSGVDREHARRMVAEKIDNLLETWRLAMAQSAQTHHKGGTWHASP